MKIRVAITRKGGLSDPEGVEVHRALGDLGYAAVSEVHFGRTITITMDGDDAVAAVAGVEEMCKRLLTNPVIEDYVVEVVE